MPKIKRKQIFILILAIIILYIVTETVPVIISKATPTTTIEYGTLLVEDDITCYALRDETVYAAPSAGSVEYSIKEGTQIKVGTTVLSFSAKDTEGDPDKEINFQEIADRLGDAAVSENITKAGRKGVFSTYVDGYEGYFTVDNFDKITEAKAAERAGQMKDVKTEDADKGQPLYKIADQSQWHMICWINGEDISRYQVGKQVTVRFDDKKADDVIFTVEKISEEGEKWKLLLSSNRYYKNFAAFRDMDVKIITTDIDGIIIDNKYLTTKDGKTGVYVVQTTGDAEFVQINALGTDGEKTAVSANIFYDENGQGIETVKVYDEILKNPESDSENNNGENNGNDSSDKSS